MKIPQLMGILNVTPDSFSDGGAFLAPEAAVAQFKQLVADGARYIDIGAESTRPGATPLTFDEEWARLEPVLSALRSIERGRVSVSIDTRHAETARCALALGVDVINDVGGLQDDAMRMVLADSNCDIVVMHSLSIPADSKMLWPADLDPIRAILEWKEYVVREAALHHIHPARLIFDPGIGFRKSAAQSLALVLRANELVESGSRWLYGHSRKSFLKLFSDVPAAERDALTMAFSVQLAAKHVDILRVHDVRGHRQLFEQLCM